MTKTAAVEERDLTDEELFDAEAQRRQGGQASEPETPDLIAAAKEVEKVEEVEEVGEPAGVSTPTPTQQEDKQQVPDKQVVEEKKPEWYASLSDEAKASYDAQQSDLADIRKKYTALHGRLAPMQQANERLRQQLEHAGQRPPDTQSNSSATSGQQTGQRPSTQPTPTLDLSTVPEFAEFMEAFPEEAKAIAALFGRQTSIVDNLQQQLGNVSQGLQQIQQASFGQQRKDELARLAEAHPDWMQVRPSERFSEWLATQPASVAQMADSPVADDCIWILDRYKQDAWAQRQVNTPAALPAANPSPSAAETVRSFRRQIRSTPGLEPQGGGVGNPVGAPTAAQSEEDIWDAEVRRRLLQQRQARNY